MKIKYICPNCGYKGKQKTFVRGSILIELVLWLAFIIPGLIYSIWRLTSKYKGCPKCKYEFMMPISTPFAQKLINRSEKDYEKKTIEKF